jgi:hypothetical protein
VRLYDVAMASLAIDAPPKWTDNVLSQHQVAGVAAAKRGIARRIPHATLLHLALTRELHTTMGLGVRDALRLASELLSADGATSVRRGSLHLELDRRRLDDAIQQRLRDALESAPSPRRGRPARRRPQ